jgi:hypothetical protein
MPTFGNKVANRIFLLLKICFLQFSKKQTLAHESALLINCSGRAKEKHRGRPVTQI